MLAVREAIFLRCFGAGARVGFVTPSKAPYRRGVVVSRGRIPEVLNDTLAVATQVHISHSWICLGSQQLFNEA